MSHSFLGFSWLLAQQAMDTLQGLTCVGLSNAELLAKLAMATQLEGDLRGVGESYATHSPLATALYTSHLFGVKGPILRWPRQGSSLAPKSLRRLFTAFSNLHIPRTRRCAPLIMPFWGEQNMRWEARLAQSTSQGW